MLSATEQMELLIKYRHNEDLLARNELVKENMRLVTSLCSKFKGQHFYEDLKQEALYGLIKSCDKYKFDKNTKFSSYACFQIRGAISNYLRKETNYRNKNRMVRDMADITELLEG